MALTKEQAQDLRQQLLAIKPGKTGRYLYCAAGADGDPVLLVNRRVIPHTQTRMLRRSARRKVFSRGTIERSSDRTHFIFRTDEPVDRMARHLRTFFGQTIPQLRRSAIISTAPSTEDDHQQSADTLQRQLADLHRSVREGEHQIQAQEDVVAEHAAQIAALQDTLFVRAATREQATADHSEAEAALEALEHKQARLHARIVEQEARLQRVMLRVAESDGALSTGDTAVDVLESEALNAERQAGAAEQDLIDLERRQATLSERRRANDLAWQRLSAADDEPERIAQLDTESETIAAELEALEALLEAGRQAAREAIRDHQIARSRAATAMEAWSEAQRSWWTGDLPEDDILHALRDAEQRLLRTTEAERGQALAVQGLEEQLRAVDQRLIAAERDSAALDAEHSALTVLSDHLVAAIEAAGTLTDTSGLEARLAEVEDQILAAASAQQEATQTLSQFGQRDQIGARLEDARSQLRSTKRQLQEHRSERNLLLLSDDAIARGDTLARDAQDAEAGLDAARTRLEGAQAAEDQAAAELIDLTTARRAAQDAHTMLSIANMAVEQLEQDATKIRLLRGGKGRSQIDAARGRLPEAQLEQRAARAAYEAAQQALARASVGHEDAPIELAQQIALAEKRASEAAAVAEAEQRAAQAALQLAEDDARAAALAAEVQGKRAQELADRAMSALPPGHRQALDAAKALDAAALVRAEESMDALFDAEMQLERAQDQLSRLTSRARGAQTTDSAQMNDIQAALQAVERLGEVARACRAEAAAADAAAEAAEQSAAEEAAALLALAADGDTGLGDALRDAQAAEQAARRDAEDAALRDAQAQERLTQATIAAADARRGKQVAHSAHEAEALIAENLDLFDALHRLEDPDSGLTRAYDLEDEDDRSAAQKALPEQMFQRVLDFQTALAQKAAQMIGDGATPAELQAAFDLVPNGLRPGAYRTEVAAFLKMEAAFSEEKEDARDEALISAARSRREPSAVARSIQVSLDGLGLSAGDIQDSVITPLLDDDPDRLEQIRLGAETLQSATAVAEVLQLLPGPIAETLDTFLCTAASLAGGAIAIRDGREGLDATEDLDPVSRQMRQDVLLDSLSELAGAGAAIGSLFAPGVGTLETARQLIIDTLEAAARRFKARYDGMLSEAARAAGSPLAGAFSESLAREEALCVKYNIQVAADAVEIAASLATACPGPGQAIQVAMELGAASMRWGQERKMDAREAQQARLARRLLADARRGDDAARAELFKHHPRYAKGLIAHMAFQEKDPFALLYARNRGLDDGDIAASSEAIIRRYLLEAAEQPLDLPEAQQKQSKLQRIVSSLSKKDEDPIIDPERLAMLQEGAQVAANIIDHQARAQRLLEPGADTDEETRDALRRLVAAEEQTLGTLRALAMDAVADIAVHARRLQDSDDDAQRRALAEARDAALAIVAQLAQST